LDRNNNPDIVPLASALASNLQIQANHISMNLRFNISRQIGYGVAENSPLIRVATNSRELFCDETEQQLERNSPSSQVCATESEDPAILPAKRPDLLQKFTNTNKLLNDPFQEFKLFSQVCQVRRNHFLVSSVNDLVHTRSCEAGLKDQIPNLGSLHGIRETLESICLQFALKKLGKVKEHDDESSELNSSGAADAEHKRIESKYTARQVLAMCLQDKQGSIQVQRYLKQIDPQEQTKLTLLLSSSLDRLLTDRFGSYVLQYLVSVDSNMFGKVKSVVLKNFIKCTTNEFSSRIMQRMFQLDQEFSVRCFELMKDEFKQLINNFSGSILLTKLVGIVRDESHHSQIMKILEQNKEYLRKAYFNRMLSTLVSCCSDQILDQVVQHIKSHVWIIMNDKFGYCILQTIFQRNHEGGIALIRRACFKHMDALLIRRYPKLLLINLIHEGIAQGLIQTITNQLVHVKGSILQTIIERRESCSLFLLMLSEHPPQSIRDICAQLKLRLPAAEPSDPDLAKILATYMSL
jgi:hypothetical protein